MDENRQEEINLSKYLQDNSQCKILFFENCGSIVISLCSKSIFKKKDCLWWHLKFYSTSF